MMTRHCTPGAAAGEGITDNSQFDIAGSAFHFWIAYRNNVRADGAVRQYVSPVHPDRNDSSAVGSHIQSGSR